MTYLHFVKNMLFLLGFRIEARASLARKQWLQNMEIKQRR